MRKQFYLKNKNEEVEGTKRVQLTLDLGLANDLGEIAQICDKPLATFIADIVSSCTGSEIAKMKRAFLEYKVAMQGIFVKSMAEQVDAATIIKMQQESGMNLKGMVSAVNATKTEMLKDLKEVEKKHDHELKAVVERDRARRKELASEFSSDPLTNLENGGRHE